MSDKPNPFLRTASPKPVHNVFPEINPSNSVPLLPGTGVTSMNNPLPIGGSANIFIPAVSNVPLVPVPPTTNTNNQPPIGGNVNHFRPQANNVPLVSVPPATGISNPPQIGGNANNLRPTNNEANRPIAQNSQVNEGNRNPTINQGNRNPFSIQRKSEQNIAQRERSVEGQNRQKQERVPFQDKIPSQPQKQQQEVVVPVIQQPAQEQKKPFRMNLKIQVRNPFSFNTIESDHQFLKRSQNSLIRPFTHLQREIFQRELLTVIQNQKISSQVLKRLDLLISCEELSQRRVSTLSQGEMNRLCLGFQFYAKNISTAVTLEQEKAFYDCLILNNICKKSVDLIMSIYKISAVSAYYVFSHAFSRLMKKPIHKLYSLNKNFKINEIVEAKHLMSIQFKKEYQNFMVRQKKFYTDCVMLRLQNQGLQSHVWRQKGLETLITEMMDIQHFKPHDLQSKDIIPNNSILMLNSTVTQIVDIFHLYNQLCSDTQNTNNRPIPLQKLRKFLLEIHQKFYKYKELVNVQGLLNTIAQMKVPQVLRDLLKRKLVGNHRNVQRNDIDIGGSWGILVNFMVQQKTQNYLVIDGIKLNQDQAQKILLKVIDSIHNISHIEAIPEWLQVIEKKVNSFCQSLEQTKAQSGLLRLQIIQFFILFQFLTKLKEPQKIKSKKQIDIHSTQALLNQAHKKIQLCINTILNKLLKKLIMFRFTISTVVVPLVYIRFHEQNKQILSNQVNFDNFKFKLVIQQDSICTLLNKIVSRENKIKDFEQLQDAFKKKLFPICTFNHHISQDTLYDKCIKPYTTNNTQQSAHNEFFKVEQLFLLALNILLQNIIRQTQVKSFNLKEKLDRNKGVFKKLGYDIGFTLQDMVQEAQTSRREQSENIPAVNNTDTNGNQIKERKQMKNLLDKQLEVLKKFSKKFILKLFNMLSENSNFRNQQVSHFQNFSKIVDFFRKIYQLFSQKQTKDEDKITVELQHASQDQKNEIIIYNLSVLDQLSKQYKKHEIEQPLWQLRKKFSNKVEHLMVSKAKIYLEFLQEITQNQSTSSNQLLRDEVVMLQSVNFLNWLYQQKSSTEASSQEPSEQDKTSQHISCINLLSSVISLYVLPFLRSSKDAKNPRLKLLIEFLRVIEKNVVRKPKLIAFIVNEIIGAQSERVMEVDQPNRSQSQSLSGVAAFDLLNQLISYTKQINQYKHRAQIQREIPNFALQIITLITSQLLKRELLTQTDNTCPWGKLLHQILHQTFDEDISVKDWPMLISSIQYKQKTIVERYVKLSLCSKLMKEFNKRQQNGMTYTFKASQYAFVPALNQENFIHFMRLIRLQPSRQQRNINDSPIRALRQYTQDDQRNYLIRQMKQQMKKQLFKNMDRQQIQYCQLYDNVIQGIWKDATIEGRNDRCSEKMSFCLGVINDFFLDEFFETSIKKKRLYFCGKIGFSIVYQLKMLQRLSQTHHSSLANLSTIPNQLNLLYMKQFTTTKISQPASHLQQIQHVLNNQQQILDNFIQSFVSMITNAIDCNEVQHDWLQENVIKMLPLIDRMGDKIKWEMRSKMVNVLVNSEFSVERIVEIADAKSAFGEMIKLLMIGQAKDSHAQFIQLETQNIATFLMKSLLNILSDNTSTLKDFLISVIPIQPSPTKLSHPCQTISQLLNLSIKTIQNICALNSLNTLQSEISKLLISIVNIVEVVYEPLFEVVGFKQHEVINGGAVDVGMFENLLQLIQRMRGMIEKLSRQQEIGLKYKQSLKQTSTYLTILISQSTKRVNQSHDIFQQPIVINQETIRTVKIQNDEQKAMKLMIYLGQSTLIPNLKCRTRKQFHHYVSLYIYVLSYLPQFRILQSIQQSQTPIRLKCTIQNYNPFVKYMNSFIQFLEVNSQYDISHDQLFFITLKQNRNAPSFWGIYLQFQRLFQALGVWGSYAGTYPGVAYNLTGSNGSRNELNPQEIINTETILLASLKIMTLTCKLFTLIFNNLNLNLPQVNTPQPKQSPYYIHQRNTIFFCHTLTLQIVTSYLFRSFNDHLKQTKYDYQSIKILRSFQSKIVMTQLFSLLDTMIGKRFLSRTELEQPLGKFSYIKYVFRANHVNFSQVRLIKEIGEQLVFPFLDAFTVDNSDAHLSQELDFNLAQSSIEQYRAKLKPNPQSSSRQNKDISIRYFTYFQMLNSLLLMRNFTKFLTTIFTIISSQNKQGLRMLIKSKNNTISTCLDTIKLYYDTYFWEDRLLDKEKRDQLQAVLRKQQQDRITAMEILRQFKHGFTKMDIQLHSLLLNPNTHPTTGFLKSICSQVVTRIVNCGIYNKQKQISQENKVYQQLAKYFEFGKYSTDDAGTGKGSKMQ